MDNTIEKKMILSFDDTEVGFSNRTDSELRKAQWLFKLMNSQFIVRLSSFLGLIALKLNLPISFIIRPTIYDQFCGGESLEASEKTFKKLGQYGVLSMVDYAIETKKTEKDFERTKDEIIKVIDYAKDNPNIPFIAMKLTGLVRFNLLKKKQEKGALSDRETSEYDQAKNRFDQICKHAFEKKITLLIDAEESWIQDEMDNLVEVMMSNYNRDDPVVYNTIQLYRTDRLDYLRSACKKARSAGYFLGLKLVRGAYMEKERARARRLGYPSPIHPNKESTDVSYDETLEYCLDNLDTIAICAATHNEKSIQYLATMIEEHGLDQKHPHIYFGQLYGMSDHITFNLAKANFNVCKYVPYGPVKEVIPYLIRRAQENTSIAGQLSRELRLIQTEIERRNPS